MQKQIPSVSTLQRLKALPAMVRNPIPQLMEWQKEYGAIYKIGIGNNAGIIITEASYIQQVLQKKHRSTEKSKIQTELLCRYTGKGLLTSTGNYWLQQRRLIQPGFHKQRLAGINTLIVNEIEKFKLILDEHAKKQRPVNISKLMMQLSSKIIGTSLFSEDLNYEDIEFISDVVVATQKHLVKIIRIPFVNRWYEAMGDNQKLLDLVYTADKLLLDIIDKRKNDNITKNDLLAMLLAVKYEDTGKGMTLKQIRDEAIILFVAGYETTANALTWLWYILDKHPTVVKKLQEENKSVLKGKAPGFEDLRNLTYNKQVVQETMRLFPPAWSMDRVALESFEIDGYPISKGDLVIPFIYGLHHNQKYWPEPEKFKPERFSLTAQKKQVPYAYVPFGGGPRLCIGIQFAIMEMQLTLAILINEFKFTLAQTHEPELQPMVTLRPKGELMMQISCLNKKFSSAT